MIRLLKNSMDIERAKMRIRVTIPSKDAKKLKEKLTSLVSSTEHEDWDADWVLVCTFSVCMLLYMHVYLVYIHIYVRTYVDTCGLLKH